jgi:hypothetical protein
MAVVDYLGDGVDHGFDVVRGSWLQLHGRNKHSKARARFNTAAC